MRICDIGMYLSIVLICLGCLGTARAGEGVEVNRLVQALILNRFENRQDKIALLQHLTEPQMQERIKGRSLDLEEVVKALHAREFNREMIAEFKGKGWVGENRRGLLGVPPRARSSMTQKERRLVREVLKEENRSRELIMKLLAVFQEGKVERLETSQIREQFSTLVRQHAWPGEWIQEMDGGWVKK